MDTPTSADAAPGSLLPAGDPDTEGFWAGVRRRQLLVPTCAACGRGFYPPLPCCPWCRGPDVELRPARGGATLYSWIVVHRALDPSFAGEVPYVVAAVHLDEGPRLFSRLVDVSPGALAADQRLTLTWIEPEGEPLWAFRPATEATR